jgi:ArsR family transcriptional regulator
MLTGNTTDLTKISHIFQLLGQPARLKILLAIGEHEVCVCHLEVLLKERQAYISQQLIFLKEGGLVDCRREGRNIYYRLTKPGLLDVIRSVTSLSGQSVEGMGKTEPLSGCPCPQCNPGLKDCQSDTDDEMNKE